MAPLKTASLPAWSWIVVAVGFLFALFLGLQVRKNQQGVDDFNQFYVGATLLRSGHLYEVPAMLAEQRATIGVERPDISPSRLPFYYAALSPLSRLPYSSAYRVWSAIVIGAALLFPLIYPTSQRAMLITASAVSLPLFIAVCGQQDVSLALLIFAVGMRLNAAGRTFVAGLVLSLLAIKFHLFFLLPIPFLLRREWRILAGAAVGGGLLLIVSFAAVGGNWLPEYFRLVMDPAVITGTINKPNLHGVLLGLPASRVLEIALSIVVVGVTWMAARNPVFEVALAAAMLGSFLLSRHAFLHDCAILIPALTYLAFCVKAMWTRVFAIALLTPFPYFLGQFMWDVRHGLIAAVLIGCLLGAVALLPRDRFDRVAGFV